MTNRELWIKIGARVDGLMSGLGKAEAGVKNFTKELERSESKRQALNEIGNGFGLVGAAAAAAGGLIIKSFADFDEAMSAVESTGQDARDNIEALRDMAIQMGATTKFNATESAAAIEEMARAGVSAKEILGGGLQGALDMAAAGNIQVGEAAAYASQAMNQFGLKGKDVPRIADLLAAAAGKANGEISDFGQALNQAGIVASDTGLSLEETTGGLAAFAQSGLLGSDAGTSFKTMLQRLNPQSKEAASLMEKLGLTAYDNEGRFVGLAEYAGRLKTAMKGMSDEQRSAAMQTLFGADAIRAANVLYREGKSGIDQWTKAVDDQGYAAETAATKMDNLKGDIEQFTGALETAMIGTGEGANGPLRDLVQQLTALVDIYNDLPQPAKDAALGALGLTAAVGGGTWAATRAITAYTNLQSNLSDLGLGFETSRKKALLFRGGALAAGIGLSTLSDDIGDFDRSAGIATDALAGMAIGFSVGGPWGAAIGGAIGLVKGFGDAHADAAAEIEAMVALYDKATGKMTEAARSKAIEDLNKPFQKGLFGTDFGAVDMTPLEAAKTAGIDLKILTDAALGSGRAMQEVNARLSELWDIARSGDLNAEAERLGVSSRDLADATAFLGEHVDENSEKWRKAGERARDAAVATGGQIETTQQLIAALAGVPTGVYTELQLLDYQPTALQIDDITRRYNLTPEQVQTVLAALDRATPLIDKVEDKRKRLDGSKANVRLGAIDAASGAIDAALRALQSLDGRSATVSIRTKGAKPNFNDVYGQADGGLLDFYANGGLRESHVAQIAPAGSWRVWAEPETGGEAYIPLHPSKRSRSIDIWAETGRRLGMQGYADGGLESTARAAAEGNRDAARMLQRAVEDGVEKGLSRVRLEMRRDSASFRALAREGGM